MTSLQVRGLECRRGERVLFTGLDFSLEAGRVVWLRGANGQGKTTLLRTLAGLAAPFAGQIVWSRAGGKQGDASPLPTLVYIAHANALKDDLTVAESLHFLLRLSGARIGADGLDAALERFGMASRRDALVRTLSQGQRRRVALARLAATPEPSPWLLDEPFDALDASGVDSLAVLIAEHARRGGSVVLTSHTKLPIDDPAPDEVHLPVALPA